jgi:hypothetical protein
VILHEDGRPLVEATPTVAAEPGRVEPLEGRLGPGLYGFRLLTPGDAAGQVTFTIGTGSGGIKRIHQPLARLPQATLRVPERVDLIAGVQRELTFAIEGGDLPPAELVSIEPSEGTVLGVRAAPGGLEARVLLGEERFPRIATVAVRDRRYPDNPPAWFPVRLIGRPHLPVQTEPGAGVTIELGGRRYGPFKADATGVASAAISVWPGEQTAAVEIRDSTGNTQRSTLNVARESQPLLTIAAAHVRAPGAPTAPVYLAAFDVHGQPWTGADPRCSLAPAGGGEVVRHGPGRYVVVPLVPDRKDLLDLRLECSLPGTFTSARSRLPMGEGIPDHLLLRVYPTSLSADFPVAQLQVLLEDRHGERLPPDRVTVGAEVGEVHVERVEGGALRGEYNGALASARGSDALWARFDRTPGEGPVVILEAGHGAPATAQGQIALPVFGRAMDELARPIAGVDLELALGENRVVARTDERGRARADLPLPAGESLSVIECRWRDRVTRVPLLSAAPAAPLTFDDADLSTEVQIPIAAGRVREVFIDTAPAILHTGPSAVARVRVRLVDRQGNSVTDDSVRVVADVGEVGALRMTEDSTYEAWFRPPPDLRAGTIQLSAIGQQGAAVGSTKLELIPRPLIRAAGLSAGLMTNFGTLTSPVVSLVGEGRPFANAGWILLRGGMGYYQDRKTILDDATGETIRVTTRFLPLSLGGGVRHERGLDSVSFGGALVGLIYRLETTFADLPSTAGAGVGGPGAQLQIEYGRRVGAIGEFYLGLGYLLVTIPGGSLGYNGPVGGMAMNGGYRVLF